MIMAYLLDKCVAKLKSINNWNSKQVGVTPEGRPVPLCNDFFVSFFADDTRLVYDAMPQDCHVLSLDFTARVSLRTTMTPADRLDNLYYIKTISLMRIATTVMKTLMDYRETIRTEVNSALSSDKNEYNVWMGMTRSYKWQSTNSTPEPRDPAWFYSREPSDIDSFNIAGYSIDISFGEGRGSFRSSE